METFIVRVYQRDPNEPSKMAGAVEIPGVKAVLPFESGHSLYRILSSPIAGGNKDGRHDEC